MESKYTGTDDARYRVMIKLIDDELGRMQENDRIHFMTDIHDELQNRITSLKPKWYEFWR